MCPRIFHIYGPLWVNGYGLMIALGFMLFTYLTYRHPRRKRLISDENYLNVLFIGFLSAIVGGRFLFVLFNLFSFDSVAEIFYPWVGGFSLFGSIIFVLVAVSIY
ncbi:prolipoprotein diacylglyceryl transferase [Candidatus Dependentiae bacterium]|nr:prolipoprotein diacylglyceryl transferase [Candidatus Dependentiae bacterium]